MTNAERKSTIALVELAQERAASALDKLSTIHTRLSEGFSPLGERHAYRISGRASELLVAVEGE